MTDCDQVHDAELLQDTKPFGQAFYCHKLSEVRSRLAFADAQRAPMALVASLWFFRCDFVLEIEAVTVM